MSHSLHHEGSHMVVMEVLLTKGVFSLAAQHQLQVPS